MAASTLDVGILPVNRVQLVNLRAIVQLDKRKRFLVKSDNRQTVYVRLNWVYANRGR